MDYINNLLGARCIFCSRLHMSNMSAPALEVSSSDWEILRVVWHPFAAEVTLRRLSRKWKDKLKNIKNKTHSIVIKVNVLYLFSQFVWHHIKHQPRVAFNMLCSASLFTSMQICRFSKFFSSLRKQPSLFPSL